MMNTINAKVTTLLKSDTIIIIVGILTILPFIILSFFNHPTSDDFYFFNKSRDLGFWNAQVSWYNEWTGRYFSTAVLSLYPLLTKSFFLYKIIPVVLLLSLLGSIYYLSSILFSNLKKGNFIVLTLCLVTLYLLQMPLVSQGFYWLAGSISYQLGNILSILLFCFIIQLIKTNKRIYMILSILFTVFVVGSNETGMILIDFLLGIIFFYNLYQNKKINYSLLIVLIFAAIFSMIVFKSPGNVVREAVYPDKHLIGYAFLKSISAVKAYLGIWMPLIIIFTFIYYDYFNKNEQTSSHKVFDVNPILVFIIVCFLPFVGFFVSYWSIGYLPPLRTINTIYLYFLIGFLYLNFVLLYRLKKVNKQYIVFSKGVRYLLYVVLIIYLTHNKNIKTAYSDLLEGTAYKYDLELNERYQLIRKSKNENCYVPKLNSLPLTIFAGDITNDSKDWRNEPYNNYWHKIISIK